MRSFNSLRIYPSTKSDRYKSLEKGTLLRKCTILCVMYPFLCVICLFCLLCQSYDIHLFTNRTGSSPYKLFLGMKINTIEKGMYVVAHLDQFLSETPVLKRIQGLPGESIRFERGVVFVSENEVGLIENSKTPGVTLTPLIHTVIPEGYYFLGSDCKNMGFDSRYNEFGLIKEANIKYQVWPIY